MPAFRLSQDTITRLRTKFLEFRHNREILQNIISEYIIDYTRTTGTMIERQGALREKYSSKKFTHLIWDDDGNNNIWWTAADIAIILGREKSSVTRTLAVMERSEEWRSRLLALRRTDRAANGLKIYSYKQEIFDLIIDHYEEEYLHRFAAPRHGDKAQDIDEIKKFWEYLKVTAELEHENFIDDSNSNEDNDTVLEIPPLTYKNILSLIWQKVFTVKIMTITSVIFALCFEIARHFYITKYFFPVSSLIIFAACLFLIRKGISRLDIISDTGAGSLLFLFLWLGGISSGNFYPDTGTIKHEMTAKSVITDTPGSWVDVYRLDGEIFVTVVPVLYSDFGGECVEALEYGINSQPDKMIKREDLKEYYEKITSTRENNIEYVTSRIFFTDGTRTETRLQDLKD